MAQVLEDLRRLFPRRSLLLQTYLLGCSYLFNKKVDRERRAELRRSLLRCVMIPQHKVQLEQFRSLVETERQLTLHIKPVNRHGLLALTMQTRSVAISDYQVEHPESFVHSLQIGNKNSVDHFSLDDLETVVSYYEPDLWETKCKTTSDLTRSCIF